MLRPVLSRRVIGSSIQKVSFICRHKHQQIVAVVGSGAVGLFYGSRLLESELNSVEPNIDVNFIMRRDYEFCRKNGFCLDSPDGRFTLPKDPQLLRRKIHRDASTINLSGRKSVDWLIFALKSYALSGKAWTDIKELVAPLINEKSRVLVIMNGLGCEEKFVEWLGKDRLFVGMAFTCVNRENPAYATSLDDFTLVKHIAFGALQIGHCRNDKKALDEVRSLFSNTIISSKVSTVESLRFAQWAKLCWNIPFTGLCVALGGVSTDVIASIPSLRTIADEALLETIALANEDILFTEENEGNGGSPKLFDVESTRSYCWHLTDTMGPYKPSTVLDLSAGLDFEVEYIFNRPLQRALALQQLGRGSYPRIETIVGLVNGIHALAEKKRDMNLPWNATYLTDAPIK